VRDIFINISVMCACLLVIGQLFNRSTFDRRQTLKVQALSGLSFGALSVVLMLYTIRLPENVIIDLRHVAIICVGIMGGPLAPILAAIITAVSRILIFGVNNVSISAFVTAILTGVLTSYIGRLKLARHYKYLLMFGCYMLISSTALLYLIRERERLLQTVGYYWHVNLLGAAMAYFTCQYIIAANTSFRTMEYYRMTADNLLDMISTHKPSGEAVFVTPSVEQLVGYTPEEFIGTMSYEHMHPEDRERMRIVSEKTRKTGASYTEIFRMRRKDGRYIWVETSVKPMLDDNGAIVELLCVTRDVTARMKIEQELRVSNARLKAIFDNAGTGIVIRDCNENLIDANPAYLEMIGYSKEEVEKLSDIVHSDDYSEVNRLFNDMIEGKYTFDKSEIRYVDKNEQVKYLEVTSTFIPGTEYTPASIVRVVNDITEAKEKEEELIRAKSEADKLAATDFLTGLLTRRAFTERLEEEFQRAIREKTHLCVIMVDVDHFKSINDIHGHQVGDLVLQKLTKCLSKVLRAYDFIGRHGGEEFLVCLPNTKLEQGVKIAERMRKAVSELKISLLYLKDPIKLTASFGVASHIPSASDTPDKLISLADRAMYDAKESGRNKVCIADGKLLSDDGAL
jgi:diguanylate cyclase (GGDEF)-like protein/PAS domain S-box-containing protein